MTNDIHSRLRMAADGKSFRKLAQVTGLNAETVRRYMQGQTPSVLFLSNFCTSLGVSANWLLTGDGPMYAKDIQREAMGEMDAGELMSAMADQVHHLFERVDRLEAFVQQMDVLLHAHLHDSDRAPTEHQGRDASGNSPSVGDAEGHRSEGKEGASSPHGIDVRTTDRLSAGDRIGRGTHE